MITVSARVKAVHALDCLAIVTGRYNVNYKKFSKERGHFASELAE
jgi:hypothetical protein